MQSGCAHPLSIIHRFPVWHKTLSSQGVYEMKELKMRFAVLSLVAAMLCSVNAHAAVVETFFAGGSSAQFNTFALAGGFNVFGGGPLCGTHHWTQKNPGGSNTIAVHDPRSTVANPIPDEPGNIWIIWNTDAANGGPNGVVCYYIVLDSIVGVREYQASGTLVLPAGLVGSADANIVPLLGAGETLPAAIQTIVNGSTLNVGVTDVRAEDAKFGSNRAMTTLAQQVTGRSSTGLGFGPFPIGTKIQSAVSAATAQPVDFAIDPGDVDPISGGAVRHYTDFSTGAAPVMVIVNFSDTASGHIGDPALAVSNVNLAGLANFLAGGPFISTPPAVNNTNFGFHIRDLSTASGASSVADVGIHTFVREPLSGTYNTMEFCGPNSRGIGAGDPAFGVGTVVGQDANVAANPLSQTAPNGGTRKRVIGSGEMVAQVNNNQDGFGYTFWNFSSFNGKACTSSSCVNGTNALKYLTVNGVDPLFSGPSANPNGAGVLPQCTTSGGVIVSCPVLPFTHVVDGSYPIWTKYRALVDTTDPTNIAATLINTYVQEIAANPANPANPGSGILTDLVPSKNLAAFRSHYAQVVRDSGIAFGPNNGFKAGVPETGGDAGGAVLTITSELDFIADTGGNQQVNLKQ
jgi:hypothetical protein